jgi:hypothetical protein
MITSADEQTRMPNAASSGVVGWIGPELRRHAFGELISALMKVVIGMVAAAVLSALTFYFVGRLSVGWGLEGVLVALAVPPAVLLLALVPQSFKMRAEQGVMQVHGQRIPFTDYKSLIGNPNETEGIANLLMFPAWLFLSALGSLRAAVRLMRADAEFCARVLSYLATEDRRVYVGDLEHTFSSKLVPALRALQFFPGVQVTSRETPALLLSPELGAQIRDML